VTRALLDAGASVTVTGKVRTQTRIRPISIIAVALLSNRFPPFFNRTEARRCTVRWQGRAGTWLFSCSTRTLTLTSPKTPYVRALLVFD
jgi:hypothetical protein